MCKLATDPNVKNQLDEIKMFEDAQKEIEEKLFIENSLIKNPTLFSGFKS